MENLLGLYSEIEDDCSTSVLGELTCELNKIAEQAVLSIEIVVVDVDNPAGIMSFTVSITPEQSSLLGSSAIYLWPYTWTLTSYSASSRPLKIDFSDTTPSFRFSSYTYPGALTYINDLGELKLNFGRPFNEADTSSDASVTNTIEGLSDCAECLISFDQSTHDFVFDVTIDCLRNHC